MLVLLLFDLFAAEEAGKVYVNGGFYPYCYDLMEERGGPGVMI